MIRRVEYAQPTTTVVGPVAGRLYRSPFSPLLFALTLVICTQKILDYWIGSFAIFGNFEVNKNCHFWQFLESDMRCKILPEMAKKWLKFSLE